MARSENDEEEVSLLAGEENVNIRNARSQQCVISIKFLDFGVSGEPEDGLPRSILIRNLIAFWLLGLCNNFAYCIMLSAAHDILSEEGIDSANNTAGFNPERECNSMSTGAILLADIIPSVVVKMIAPFILSFTYLQVALAIILALLSFIAVAFANAPWLTYTGVAFASLSSGLGETTLLRYSTSYTKNVISTWSSGTGMSGVLGSFSYAAITSTGFSPRDTLLTMIIVPALMGVTFFFILVHPNKIRQLRERFVDKVEDDDGDAVINDDIQNETMNDLKSEIPAKEILPLTFKNMLLLIVPLLKYMIPLALVYLAEYFINQGLVELIYFKGISLNHDAQYRWYQVLYQVGVFISRSSVNFFQLKQLWILPILQFANVIIFVCEAYYLFMPSIWIIFVLILYEGLLGGCSYVNTFYRITQEVDEPYREFSMGAASMSDSIGTTIAGFIAIPVHTALCKSPIPS